MDPDGSGGWRHVVAAGLAIFVAQLDTTVVAVALPEIGRDLGIGVGLAQWVVLGYLVPVIALSLATGRWVDRAGPRAAVRVGVSVFGLFSLLSAVAPNATVLILSRVAKGVGGAVLMAAAPSLAVASVNERARARGLAVVGTLAPLGGMCGPIVGGFVLELSGWRAVFLAVLPVVACVFGMAAGSPGAVSSGRSEGRKPAVASVGLLGAAAATLLAGLTPGADGALHNVWLVAIGLSLTALWWRRWGGVELAPVGAPGMPAIHLAFAGVYLAVLGVQFLTPYYMTRELGLSPATVGLSMMAYPGAAALAGPISGWAADRWGARRIALTGVAVVIVAVAAFARLGDAWTPATVAAHLACVGLGFGLFATPNQALALSSVPNSLTGRASASTNLARIVGLAAGPAMATAVWGAAGYAASGMRAALAVAAATAALALAALTLVRPAERVRPSVRNRSTEPTTQIGRS